MLFTHYGQRFKDMRKALQQEFNSGRVMNYQDSQIDAVHELLQELLCQPKRFNKAFRG